MKRSWKGAGRLALALASSMGLAQGASAMLTNGNLDATSISSQILATPTGWVAASDNNDGLSSEPWNNVAAPGGSGVFFKSFFGDPTAPFNASMHQDNPGTPGLTYILSGWVGSGPGYSGETDPNTKTELALDFLSASNSLISSSILSLGAAQLGTATGHPAGFDYAQYTVSGVAPAGTATVRSRFSMKNAYDVPNAGDAALVTDAYELRVVPEPSVMALAGLAMASLAAPRRRK